MKYTSLILSAFLFSVSIAHAEIYVCKKANGTTEYTAEAKMGCVSMTDTKIGGYSSVASEFSYSDDSSSLPSLAESTSPSDDARRIAEQRLLEAERALAENKSNNLNDVSDIQHQERIRNLEEEVRRAREALNQIP